MSKHKVLVAIFLILGFLSVAQLQLNSPYSRFGLGNLNRPGSAFNKGMGGVATSLTSSNDINTFNPALLFRTNTVTFEFGGSHTSVSAKQGDRVNNSNEFSFEYINLAFPITPRYSLAFGLQPYSDVGYSTTEDSVKIDNDLFVQNIYSGTGGINAINVTNSYTVIRDSVNKSVLSLGLDASFLVGKISRNNTSTILSNSITGRDQSNYSNNTSYQGFKFKLGSAYRKEIFAGKVLKERPSCDNKDSVITVSVNSLFYQEEVEKLSETAFVTDYVVIFPGQNKIILSSKIKSSGRREQLFSYYSGFLKKGYGVFVLPEAVGVNYEKIKENYTSALEKIKIGEQSKSVMPLKRIAKEYLRVRTGIHFNAGLAYEIGSNINTSGETKITRTNTLTGVTFSENKITSFDGEKVMLPQAFHLGFSIDKEKAMGRDYCKNKLKSMWALGTDLSVTNWSEYNGFNVAQSLKNTYRLGVGGSFTPDSENSNEIGFLRLINKSTYRTGFYHQTLPYEAFGSQISEFGTTFGITMPTNRSGSTMTWNLTYARRNTEIVENYLKVGVGVTLNERSRWFKKYEVGL